MIDKAPGMHPWVEERLSAYVDKQLAPNERARLETHLRDCARCQASLASLRWTLALLKQAPAPALPRTFYVPEKTTARATGWTLRAATAMATLALFVVVGIDVFIQYSSPAAPAPAAEFAAPKQNIALAPTPVPPQPAAQPLGASPTLQAGARSAEVQATAVPADATQKARETAPAAPALSGAKVPPTVTPTLLPPSPTPTPQLEARVLPTPARDVDAESPRLGSTLRVIELGLLALVLVLGGLTIFVSRRE